MPEEKKEIELKEGESKEIEINIPLAVDDVNRPEVKPKSRPEPEVNENLNEPDENQNQDDQAKQGMEQSSQNKEGQDPELGPIGQMSQRQDQRPERRGDSQNKEAQSSEADENHGKQGDQGGEGEQKPEGDGQKEQGKQGSELGPIGKMNQRKKQEPKNNKSSLGDKMAETAGRLGDKILPKARIPEKRKKGEEELDSKYEPGATKKQNLTSSWNKLRGSIKNKKKDNSKESRSATGQIINKGSRLLSFEFYRLCWLNLIDSFGLTYFGLLFLFIARYVAHSDKIAKFVTIKDESVRLKIIEHKEVTSIPMMIAFLMITGLLVLIIVIIILLIMLILWAMGMIEIEGFSGLEFFIDAFKNLF